MGDEARGALSATLAATAGPYGFTLTIWGSAALVVGRHGLPGTADVAGFAAGAVAAFTTLAAAATQLGGADTSDDSQALARARTRAGALNWLAVGGALTLAWAAAHLPSPVAWPATGGAVTAAYLMAAAAQAYAVRRWPAAPRWRRRRSPAAHRGR